MDAYEAQKAFAVFAEGLGKLCDELYAATQAPPDAEALQALVRRGHDRLRAYDDLHRSMNGGMQASLQSSYSSEKEEIEHYLSVLDPSSSPLHTSAKRPLEETMTKRRFEYSDEKSNKFWEIAVDGARHTVCYGRIGTDGQTKTKSFDDAEAAAKDADKLMKSKTKKGYEEVALVSADGPAEQLWALLKGLCKSDDDEAVLKNLCTYVTTVSEDTITFEHDGYEWEVDYSPGIEVVYHPAMPKSFCEIMGVVSSIGWDGGGPEVGYGVGEDGQSSADEWMFAEWAHDDADGAAAIREKGDIIASFFAGQNALFFDPTTTLSNGEPGLAFLSHEGGGWTPCESVKTLDYGQMLLRLLSDCMVDTDHVAEAYF